MMKQDVYGARRLHSLGGFKRPQEDCRRAGSVSRRLLLRTADIRLFSSSICASVMMLPAPPRPQVGILSVDSAPEEVC